MSLSNSAINKIQSLATAIINLITTHSNLTGSSLQKGHVQAGGAPQTIGTSLSAGTDNGYYARADHVHTVDYSNIQNKHTADNSTLQLSSNTYSIKNNGITLDKLNISDFKISGTNLLKGTQAFTSPTPSGSSLNGTYNGCAVRYLKNTTSSFVEFSWTITQEELEPGAYYTLSFWAKATTTHSKCVTFLNRGENQTTTRITSNSDLNLSTTAVTTPYDGNTYFTITPEWRRYYVIYKLTDTEITNTKGLKIRLNADTTNNPDIYLAGVKFEKGGIPTAWSPNPNDLIVTVEKLGSAEDNNFASYIVKQNGVKVGNTINIPKDFLVKSGAVYTVGATGAKTAVQLGEGYETGDKYIDFVINSKEDDDTDAHMYINVKDLMDTYTAGTGLTLSNGKFRVNYGTTANTVAEGNHVHYNLAITANVSADDDLDTYTTMGWYRCADIWNINITNAPTTENSDLIHNYKFFMLDVEKNGSSNVWTQTLYTLPDSTYQSEIFYRKKYGTNNNWTNWVKIATTNDMKDLIGDAITYINQ